MHPHRKKAITNGWQALVERVQSLIRQALVTHELHESLLSKHGQLHYTGRHQYHFALVTAQARG